MVRVGDRVRGWWRRWELQDRRRQRLQADDSTLVDRLRGTQFENVPRATGTLSEEEAARVMRLTLRLGQQMFLCGAETDSVGATLIAVTNALGLTYLEVDITGRAIHLQYSPPGKCPLVMLKVTRTDDSRDLNRMSAVDTLIRAVVYKGMPLDRAEREIGRVENVPPALPWWVMLGGGGILAASISLQANGTPVSALLAVLLLVVVNRLGWFLGKVGLPSFYVVAIQSFVAVGAGILGAGMGWWDGQVASSMAAANLVLLLPILSVVSLAQDAITGFNLMAAARIVSVTLTLAGILVGAVLVSAVAHGMDVAGTEQVTLVSMPLWVVFLACAVGAIGNTLLMGGALRLIPVATLAGAVAGLVNNVGNQVLGLPSPIAVLFAAVLLGIGSTVLSERLEVPRAAIFVPGITGALLPGPGVYRALAMYAADMEGAGHAVAVTLMATAAIGAGIVLGDYLGSAADRRHIRRKGSRVGETAQG